ncbi:hypothetical protein DFJ73DRAFT_834567 [Zopfochytrium polystomum]|nr:hypothetical protein DFJ73DRAFT_834567 [Zopfochytrium polystomum]
MRILVVGAGIAGSAAAIALRRAGHDVEVFDRPIDFPDVPHAAYLAENGMRAIKHLGLLDAVVREASRCDRHEIRDFRGNLVAAFPTAGNGADLFTVTIKRSTLVRILTNALVMEGVYVHTDKFLVDIEQPPGDTALGVKAKFKDGTVAYGDILIGADGVHSGVRKTLFPRHSPIRVGFIGHYGITDLDHSMGDVWPSGNVHYYTDNANAKSGMVYRVSETQLFWFVMEMRPDEISHDGWRPMFDLYERRNAIADMVRRWGMPESFQPLIRASKEIVPTTIYDLEVLPQWWRGNCVLIGGAKHAMPPFLGHVNSVAFEDAEVLAALLNRFPEDPRRAFHLYQEARYHRVARIADAVRTHAKRHYATSPFAATVGKLVLKIVSAVGGPMSSDEIMAYDGQAAVADILLRHGYL